MRTMQMRPLTGLLAIALVGILAGAPLRAQQAPARFALVIGNSHYEGGTWRPLANPGNDVAAVARALRAIGFEIVGCGSTGICLDADRPTIDKAIQTLGSTLEQHPHAIAFIYYSGHGLQARRTRESPDENFLVPVNSGLEKEFEVAYKAIPEQQLLDMLAAVDIEAGIVVLDACRTNDLRRAGKSGTKGLARNAGAKGILLAYAAEPGEVALDGTADSAVRVSPYARRLAENLLRAKSITDVFLDADAQVAADTHGAQQPEAVIRLTHNLYLAGQSSGAVTTPPAGPPADAAATAKPSPLGEPATAADMNSRGNNYFYGTNGFAQNDTEAVRWYRKAAELGSGAAQASMGFMYQKGRGGLAPSDAEAVRWYTRSAEQGSPLGQVNLGVMYENGQGGLPKNDVEAVRWYTRSAQQGNARGQASLGTMYEYGKGGLAKSDAEAVRWYSMAAKQGDSDGQAWLADMYENGKGGLARDDGEAVRLYTLAARQGNTYAQDHLKTKGLSW